MYSGVSRQAYQYLQANVPFSPYALALKGEAKLQKQQYPEALAALTEAARNLPNVPGIQADLAAVYRATGKSAEAAEADRAEANLPAPDCEAVKVQCEVAAGHYEQAIELAKLDNSPRSIFWLARAAQHLAADACQAANDLPDTVERHTAAAQQMERAGKYREAVAEWRAALRIESANHGLQNHLAAALFLSADYKAALPELRQFLQADPSSANLNFFVGDSLFETERLDEAVPFLQKALSADSHLLPAHVALGLCYGRLGKPLKAIPHLKAGLSLDRDGALYYQLSRAYTATKQPALAKQMMDRYNRTHQPDAPTSPAP